MRSEIRKNCNRCSKTDERYEKTDDGGLLYTICNVYPYFKDGFSYQTGVGGASIASTISLAKIMKERGIRMRFGVGGLTKPMCDLLDNNQVDVLLDTQDFDLDAVESVKDIRHFRISAGEYADPFNKGAVVNKLDFVILAALEVDVNFNCNVVVGSDGVITGAQEVIRIRRQAQNAPLY